MSSYLRIGCISLCVLKWNITEILKTLFDNVQANISSNISEIEKKKAEPSRAVRLEQTNINRIAELIDKGNEKIFSQLIIICENDIMKPQAISLYIILSRPFHPRLCRKQGKMTNYIKTLDNLSNLRYNKKIKI